MYEESGFRVQQQPLLMLLNCQCMLVLIFITTPYIHTLKYGVLVQESTTKYVLVRSWPQMLAETTVSTDRRTRQKDCFGSREETAQTVAQTDAMPRSPLSHKT